LVVLDSSAVIAVILDEPGAEVVLKELANAVIAMPNVAEVYSVISRKIQNTRSVDAFFALNGVNTVPLSFNQAKMAGCYETIGKKFGLSLGDRCCLALAHEMGAIALTADKAWTTIGHAIDVKIRIIR
jgi:ribonuclease VapC